jgi:L-amino acid N-acyltransferase YncA
MDDARHQAPASFKDSVFVPATRNDVPGILNIINHYIATSVARFNTKPLTEADYVSVFQTVETLQLPFIVALKYPATGDKKIRDVIGFAYAAPFIPNRDGYRHTLELSVYLHPDHRKGGIGTPLLNYLLDMLRQPAKYHSITGAVVNEKELPVPRQLIANVALDIDGQDGGWGLIRWYERKFGFKNVGRLESVGWKFGRW